MAAFSKLILEWQQFFTDLGWVGVLAYAGLIVVAQAVCMPLSPLAIAGGLMFGVGRGWAAITIGTVVGAALNFLLARYLVRERISRWLAHHRKFQLIDAAIGREGWKIIVLLRFCPIPYGIANYSIGLTAVRFAPYLLATAVSVTPANFFFSWFGATSQNAIAAVQGAGGGQPGKIVFACVGLIAFSAALTYVTRIARAAVAKHDTAGPETIVVE
jgi:uncharacterized membrane protein YdjX (TVP38/TMEM64 family)